MSAGTTGSFNVCVGGQSGESMSTGGNNVFLGHYSGGLVTTGSNNIFLGYGSGFAAGNVSSSFSVNNNFAGVNALFWGSLSSTDNRVAVNTPEGTTLTSTFQINGSLATAYVAKTANYVAAVTDYTIECTTGTFTVTLPTAVGIAGRTYVITNSGTGVITISSSGGQTFVNVIATPTSLTLNQFNTVTLSSNGANWLRISSL
jgi:hypothetical protein